MSMTRRHFLGGILAVALTRPGRALLARQTSNDVSLVMTGVDWGSEPDYMVQLQRIGPYTKDWRVMDTAERYPDAYVRLAYDSTHDEAIGIVTEYRIPREVWQAQARMNQLKSMEFETIVVKKIDGLKIAHDWEAMEKYLPSGPVWDAAAKATAKEWADRLDRELADRVYGDFSITPRHVDPRTGAEYFSQPTWGFQKTKKEIWSGS